MVQKLATTLANTANQFNLKALSILAIQLNPWKPTTTNPCQVLTYQILPNHTVKPKFFCQRLRCKYCQSI
jgi:hypothetical protein